MERFQSVGVRQGDIILVTTILVSVFKKLDWNGNKRKCEVLKPSSFRIRLRINLNHLQTMISQLNDESIKVGLKTNFKC